MAVSAYRMATSRDEPSPWRLAQHGCTVLAMVCDLERGAECAEFTDKALVHAAAMPSGAARSRTMGILRLAQVRVLILQGTTDEAEALAAQFLIEPLCCELTLHLIRSWALRLGGRYDEAARAADQAISMARAKGGLFDQQPWLLAWRGLAELDSGRPAQALASAEQAMSLMTEARFPPSSRPMCLWPTDARCSPTAARQKHSSRCASPMASGSGTTRRVCGRPRPSTGSGKPGSPMARSSAGAGWWLKRSARWPSRPTSCTKGLSPAPRRSPRLLRRPHAEH